MSANCAKEHKGKQPSPVAGMDISRWLSYSRMHEHELEGFLTRNDLTPDQRMKLENLLSLLRSKIREQLEKLNVA